jgi:hypothetical protein
MVMVKASNVDLLTDFYVFSTPEQDMAFLNAVCMYGWMDEWTCASLAPKQFEVFYSYYIFNSLSAIGRFSVNINVLAP